LGGLIDYSIGAPLNYISMIDVLDWIDHGDQERLRSVFAGKPVLFGAVLPLRIFNVYRCRWLPGYRRSGCCLA